MALSTGEELGPPRARLGPATWTICFVLKTPRSSKRSCLVKSRPWGSWHCLRFGWVSSVLEVNMIARLRAVLNVAACILFVTLLAGGRRDAVAAAMLTDRKS